MEGKVALITGASAGIGRAAALLFARNGARVAVSDVDAERGEQTAAQIRRDRGKAIFVHADVSRADEVRALIDRTVEHFGGLDCAFNNAGIEGPALPTAGLDEERWDRVISINLKGIWLCMKYEIPAMLARGRGAIVNMSSVAGLIGFQEHPAYVASKHGVLGLTKTAALEYATRDIRINAVCPGVIHTEMIDRITERRPEVEREFVEMEPIGRMGRPEEVAEAALWLCSDASSFVTGAALPIDGGFLSR